MLYNLNVCSEQRRLKVGQHLYCKSYANASRRYNDYYYTRDKAIIRGTCRGNKTSQQKYFYNYGSNVIRIITEWYINNFAVSIYFLRLV